MSLLTDLFSTLDPRSLSGIGSALGESEQTISRGMQPAIATVLGGLATKADNPNLLLRALDFDPSGSNHTWSSLATGLANASSPGATAGRSILSTLFGNSEGMITQALGAGTGLTSGLTGSLLAMAAPMVMGFIGRRVHDQGMNMGGLGGLLQREVPTIKENVPAGVSNLLWPAARETVAASPVIAQTVTAERQRNWYPLLLLLLIPGLIWLFSHNRRPVVTAPMGTANRYIPAVPVPAAPRINIPAPAALPENVDVYFETGSSRLRPESTAKLDAFAAALKANPNANVTVSGFTDNTGNSASNMRLSQNRANTVKADLVRRGISADRLTAKGLGEENPIADNNTADGRHRNRRVSVSATAA
jgi:outer membrane protein OmpA-like peptidoglycan-associated protein